MRKEPPFIGRKNELQRLTDLANGRSAKLVVLKGRRRIGKTRLAEEFGKNFKSLFFTGLPPTEPITAQVQRENFASQLVRQLQIPNPKCDDWNDLFWTLAHYVKAGPVLIVLDEISWLGSADATFLGKLKTAWDSDFKKNPNLIMILTGSVSSWIENNILNSTGFFGRVSLEMTLEELPLYRCNEFWGKEAENISAFEKFKLLAVTGGVPRYLEAIDPTISSEENIRRLCFQSGGLLVKEYPRIFSDLFHKKSAVYSKIVDRLVEGPCLQEDIRAALKIGRGGGLREYLYDLETAGFIRKDFTWDIQSSRPSNLRQYRLKDNYLRFYLKYIHPNLDKIENNLFQMSPLKWSTIFGLQFENLVLNNRRKILELLHIPLDQVARENPYFQKKTQRRSGCQIDYLVQTRDNILHLCEIKFSKDPISSDVIGQVRKKVEALNPAKGFSVRPILIHVNGVSDTVLAEEYFSKIIDFSELLEAPTSAF